MNQNFVIKHIQSNTYLRDLVGYTVTNKDNEGNDISAQYVKPSVTRDIHNARFFNESSEAISWCKKIKELTYTDGCVMDSTLEVILVTHIPSDDREEIREEITWFTIEV